MRSPQAEAMRGWPLSAAGIEDAPGSVRPMASTIDVMVDAVPMVLQVPMDAGHTAFKIDPVVLA